MPDGVIFRHGFTPVGHDKRSIDFLGLVKMSRRIVILKIVELRETASEFRLRRRRTRIFERRLSDALGGRSCGAAQLQRSDQRCAK